MEKVSLTKASMPGWLAFIAAILLVLSSAYAFGSEDQTRQTGKTYRDCPECPEMVVIPAGHFLMGVGASDGPHDPEPVAPNKALTSVLENMHGHPQHPVSIDRSFALSKYRVTRGEFAAFVRETAYSTEGGCTLRIDHAYPDHPEAGWQHPGFAQTDRDPVVCVSWQDAKAYIAWLNSKMRGPAGGSSESLYRLPSEAEWEYAARGGTQTARWWGDSIGSGNADCGGCGSRWDKKQPAPAGSFQTNGFGLSDVLGSTWEWNEDCWNETYAGAQQDGSASKTGKCELRVMRGGSWDSLPWIVQSGVRSREGKYERTNYIGFRVAKTLP